MKGNKNRVIKRAFIESTVALCFSLSRFRTARNDVLFIFWLGPVERARSIIDLPPRSSFVFPMSHHLISAKVGGSDKPAARPSKGGGGDTIE